MIEIPSIVQWLLKNFVDMLPAKIIREYERGVLFKKGIAARRDLRAGKVHWYRPFLDSIERVDVQQQVDILPAQSVTTKDGHSVVARLNVKYRVWSAWRVWVVIHDPYQSLYALVQGYTAEYASTATWAALKTDHDTTAKGILELVAPIVRPWGFIVDDINFVELVESSHYRLFGDSSHSATPIPISQ